MADQAGNAAANGDLGSHQHQQGQGSAGSSPPSTSTSTPPPPPAQGRNIRQSQYAEAIANPLPELAVVAEPEPVSNLARLECDDTASSTRAVVQPDDISDHRPSAIVYAGEKPTLWRKYRAPVIVALIVLVIVLVGTVVGVVVSNSNKDHSAGASPSTSATSSSTATMATGSSSTSSSASATGSSTRIPSQCADLSDFLTSVSFMGVNGNGGWKTTYCGSASSSKDCCACCYKNKEGCNSWAYMPSTGFAGTSCALIVGWDTGDDKDSTCPSGHGATVYFTTDSDQSSDVGAAGPCGVV